MKNTSFCILNILIFLSGILFCSCDSPQSGRTEEERTDSLLKASLNLIYTHPNEAMKRITEGQRSLKDSANWYMAEIFRGTALILADDSIGGEQAYNRVMDWCNRHAGHERLAATVWNHRGVNATFAGRKDEGVRCYLRAFDLLKQLPQQTKEILPIAINIADYYCMTGNIPAASDYYHYALFICDSLNTNESLISVYAGLGQVYMELHKFDEAHRYYHLAQQHTEGESDQSLYFLYLSIGNCYYYEEKYREALSYFAQAKSYADKLDSPVAPVLCDGNMAEICLMLDSLPAARTHLDCALGSLNQVDAYDTSIFYYLQSLRADLALAGGRKADAQKILRQYPAALLKDFPRYLMLHYRRLERYAVREKEWEKAYDYARKSRQYTLLIRNQQTRNNVLEMEQRFARDTTLLNQRIVLAGYETRNVRQQNYIILAVSAALVIVLLSLLLFLLMRRQARERTRRQMERINELRMDIVRNRVSPHFIFNVLGTILPRLQRYPDLMIPIDLLIDVLRGNLLSSGKMSVALKDELKLVRNFVRLHHLSKGNLPRVEWEVDESLEHSDRQVPSMSLQIPLENALKHAFVQLTDESLIRVTVTCSEGWLKLRVADNGSGYNPGKVRPTGRDTGTGLRLLSRTIEILNRYNRQAAVFSITSLTNHEHGTVMELHLPDDYRYQMSDTTE